KSKETARANSQLRDLNPLANYRDALASPNAGGRQSVSATAAIQFAQQGENQPGSGCAQRMSQGDRAAIDICLFSIETQLLLNGKILRRECFVYFDQIDVRKFHSGSCQSLTGRGHRTDSHNFRFYSGVGPTYYAADGFEIF